MFTARKGRIVYMSTFVDVCVYAYMHTDIHAYRHTCIHLHTYRYALITYIPYTGGPKGNDGLHGDGRLSDARLWARQELHSAVCRRKGHDLAGAPVL